MFLSSASSFGNTCERCAHLSISSRVITFADATDDFLNSIGLDRDDVVGRSLNEIFCSATAGLISDAIRNRLDQRMIRLRNVDCTEPGILPIDIELSDFTGENGTHAKLRLIPTAMTDRALGHIYSALFEPSSRLSPSMLFFCDVPTRRVRTFRNNLTERLGLGNSFTLEEFDAVTHPEDANTLAAYLNRRLRLPDGEFSTFDQRMRSVTGEWRIIAGRSRTIERGPDGLATKTMGVIFDVTEFHEVNRALLTANAALTRAEQNEREHLGRDLHDSLSPLLVGARLAIHALQSGPADAGQIEEASVLLGRALDEIRAFAFLLHPPDLKVLGLAQAVENLCLGSSRRFALPIKFEATISLPPQSEQVEFALFRVAQEALMNVHRHARATEACVRIDITKAGALELDIRDNGIGIVPAGPGLPSIQGVGLSAMRARMLQVGGYVTIENCHPGVRVVAGVDRFFQ